ncbi:methylated-DNA--[protein]-cysteine S-methyltransferase [Rubrivivax sp. RP6-9]|uniref:methylated-DNA--[protein]-cysteine S-methyltransferase n=1 Tax=Rubrivivax sp. RP6-9 TaxID=3415750 RepID=UPI003CC5D86A
MKTNRLVAQASVPTPLGPMLLAATPLGLAGAWFADQKHHPGAIAAPVDAQHPHIVQGMQALQAYWVGAPAPQALALDAAGTPFQQAVWRALCAIPMGQTSSYGAIARALGRPAAVRAVGAAVGRNPIGILVPCHRVLGQDGTLTGYAGGLPRKQALLLHERQHVPQHPQRPGGLPLTLAA